MTPEPEPLDLASFSTPDLNQVLERQIAAGFPPELAFDLVLHELVVRTAASTEASAAALALARGSEMVCRAATGVHAPDLGIPLSTEEGLSGACLRTREAQICVDAESDSRVDAHAARQLGIRSMLIVPVMEDENMLGVLEVFSSQPAAFSTQHQVILEIFANECTRLQRSMFESRRRPPLASSPTPIVPLATRDEEAGVEAPGDASLEIPPLPPPARLYEGWTVILGAMAVLAAIGVSFLVGSRIGWIRAGSHPASIQGPAPVPAAEASNLRAKAPPQPTSAPARNPAESAATVAARPDELIVYDHGKVVFRMKPAGHNGNSVIAASETKHMKLPPVWLAHDLAEQRLRNRVEPIYPAAAREAHRAGEVALELLVGEDGSIVTARVVSGDPLLSVAALDAVRQWQYEPYRQNQQAVQFLTDVTLRFSLPQ